MEAWRKQCLLAYCGYYPYQDIDDDWGDQSRQATEAFQRDYQITVDGVFGDGTLGRILEVIYNQEEPSALYIRVDETHSGAADDPIPADRGMVYTYGLYYLDPGDGKTYLCARKGEEAGTTVTLHYLPHELVGQYFEEG